MRTILSQSVSSSDPVALDLPETLYGADEIRVDAVRLDNYHQLIEALDALNVQNLMDGLAAVISRAFLGQALWVVRSGDDLLAVLHAGPGAGEKPFAELEAGYRMAGNQFFQSFQRSFSTGIGIGAVSLQGVRQSFDNAQQACEYRFRSGPGSVIDGRIQKKVRLSPSTDFIRRDITAVGSWFYQVGEFPAMLELFRKGLPVSDLVTYVFPFAEAPEAFRVFNVGKSGKVLLRYGL